MLFEIASKISCHTHPVPVLASMGWKIPSSGEAALYATVCSAAALDEFFTLLLSARFGSADALLDIVGRVHLDDYINDKHMETRNNPSDQKDSGTCYAHATAAVLHMGLRRVVGRQGGTPTIREIRERILSDFPETARGWSVLDVLERVISQRWYRPILHFREVDEHDARQAVLRRRPVLATFGLSNQGWDAFSGYLADPVLAKRVLTYSQMEAYRTGSSIGGHAVVLTGCDPQSLTFLNSWGKSWGNNGTFRIKDHNVLDINSRKIAFYNVF